MIIKNTITPKRPSTDHMSIRQDITPLCIHHKACGLASHGQIGIKRRSLTEMNRYNSRDDILNSLLPLRRVSLGLAYSW